MHFLKRQIYREETEKNGFCLLIHSSNMSNSWNWIKSGGLPQGCRLYDFCSFPTAFPGHLQRAGWEVDPGLKPEEMLASESRELSNWSIILLPLPHTNKQKKIILMLAMFMGSKKSFFFSWWNYPINDLKSFAHKWWECKCKSLWSYNKGMESLKKSESESTAIWSKHRITGLQVSVLPCVTEAILTIVKP